MVEDPTPGMHPKVLFVCVENAGRSQIAAALFRLASGGRGEARSAGTRPAERVHPHVAAALARRGIDVSTNRPRKLAIEDAEWADVVVTMGCGDECPVTGKPTEDWGLPDPKSMDPADLERLMGEIGARVTDLLDRVGRLAGSS